MPYLDKALLIGTESFATRISGWNSSRANTHNRYRNDPGKLESRLDRDVICKRSYSTQRIDETNVIVEVSECITICNENELVVGTRQSRGTLNDAAVCSRHQG